MSRSTPLLGWTTAWTAALLIGGHAGAMDLRYEVIKPTSFRQVAAQAYARSRAAELLAIANQGALSTELRPPMEVLIPVCDQIEIRQDTSVEELAGTHMGQTSLASALAAINEISVEDPVRSRPIKIPGVVWYHARRGDDFKVISRRFFGHADARWLLRNANGNRRGNLVRPGERLAVPICTSWNDRQKVEERLLDSPSLLPHKSLVPPPPAVAEASPKRPIPAGAPSATPLFPGPLVEDGVALFRRGEFLSAVAYFRRVLLEPGLDRPSRIAAYVWLSSCYVAVEEPERAEEAMRAALRIDEQLTLEPSQTSPKLLRVLSRLRDNQDR